NIGSVNVFCSQHPEELEYDSWFPRPAAQARKLCVKKTPKRKHICKKAYQKQYHKRTTDAECGDLEAIGVHLDDAMLRQVYIRRPSAVPEEGTTKYCAIALAYRHCTSDEFMKLIVQCGHEENIIAEVLGSLSETYRKVYGRAIKAAGTPGGVMPKEQRGSEFYAEDAISEFDLVVSDSSLRAVNKEWPKTNGDWGSLAESLFSKPVRPSEHVDLLGNRAACQHDLMASALEGYKYHGIDVQILDVVPMSYLEAGT
ncbi:unnamed protein product, partial [Symbiodinium sp. KB8]